MKKCVVLLAALAFCLALALPVSAEEGKVTYSGNSGKFIFAPGGEHSLTDLFPNFKEVMPGDTLTQPITVQNDANKKVKVKVYIRALGAWEDSVEFLSQLNLKVQKSQENEMAYMFDAAADQTAQMTDWVYLGTLYSGGQVNLDVTLTVPTSLDNRFQDYIGRLDWEFKIEELPIDSTDPKPPLTGDKTPLGLLWGLAIASALGFVLIIILRKKNRQETPAA